MDNNIVTIILWIGVISFIGWTIWNYFRIRKASKFIENEEFASLMRTGQIIDIRDPSVFKCDHILGARNFPIGQFKTSLSALRKDKPVLLYDSNRSKGVGRAVIELKKAGYEEIYVLKFGYDYWDGKRKKG